MIYFFIIFAVIILGVIGYTLDRKKYEQYKEEILGTNEANSEVLSNVSQVENNVADNSVSVVNETINEDLVQSTEPANLSTPDVINNQENNQEDIPIIPQ